MKSVPVILCLCIAQDLFHCTVSLYISTDPSLETGYFGVSESDPPVTFINNILWSRLTPRPEIKSGLRRDIGVSPTIKDDSGYIPSWIKTMLTKQRDKLVADIQFIITIRFG